MLTVFNYIFPDKNLAYLNEIKFERRLSFLDIGARGGIEWPWKNFHKESISLVLVEPDSIEAKDLEKKLKDVDATVLPYALWRDESKQTLYLNNSLGTSSLYKSNKIFLDQFPDSTRFDVREIVDIDTRTIDSLANDNQIPTIDFAKIDVQGAELAILEGGRDFFKNELIGLEVEVEFSEMYSGQPLFADIDKFIRNELGLELWDLRKTYWKYNKGKDIPGSTKGRLIFGDALYLRSLSGLEQWLSTMSDEKASEKYSMLIVTSIAYGYLDYAKTLLINPLIENYLDSKQIKKYEQAIMSLSGGFRPFRYGNALIYMMLDAISGIFRPTHLGWASSGRRLGARRRGWSWL